MSMNRAALRPMLVFVTRGDGIDMHGPIHFATHVGFGRTSGGIHMYGPYCLGTSLSNEAVGPPRMDTGDNHIWSLPLGDKFEQRSC